VVSSLSIEASLQTTSAAHPSAASTIIASPLFGSFDGIFYRLSTGNRRQPFRRYAAQLLVRRDR